MASNSVVENIINNPFPVSEEQKKAILSEDRYVRVTAGAGAGKTEVITRKIAYLLLEKKVDPNSIVAFTFTNKAAQSMKSRIYQRVEQIAGPTATSKLGEMYIGTIHAYAKQVLDDYFGYGNWTPLDQNQEVAFLMRIGWELGIQKYDRFYANACRKFLRVVDMVQSELLDNDILSTEAPDFFKLYKGYWDKLEEYKQLTFGRMISESVKLITDAPETLSHVKYLIIDEFQDINQSQKEFIRLIGSNGSIYVVGDPRQSIYQWRGSNQQFFTEFDLTYSGTISFNITRNRRSGKKIVLNANRFAESFQDLTVEPMKPTRDSQGYIGSATLETPLDEAKWIADQIQELVETQKIITYSDIGILTRSVNTSAGPLIDEFRSRQIPYIVGGKVGLFRRDEAQAVGMIFSWFSEKCYWTPNPWKWQIRIEGDDLIDSAFNSWCQAHNHGIPNDSEAKLREIKKELYKKKPRFNNFSELYQEVLNILGFHSLDYTSPGDSAVMANLGRFNNLLTDYETANRIGGRRPKWKTGLNGLFWFMQGYGLKAYEEQPSDDIRNVNAVQLMTVHQAKGLEWPIVFLFSLTDRRFPPSNVGREDDWCGVPRHLFDASRYEGSIEDERRLFYVAITRPKDALILSRFNRITQRMRRSPFYMGLEEDMIQDLGINRIPFIEISSNRTQEEIQTFAATEIVGFNRCPQMYLLRNLWGYQPGFEQLIDYGPALHYCLKVAGELVQNEGYDPRTAVASAVDENFFMAYVSGVLFNNLKQAANETLTNFADDFGDDLPRVEEAEYRVEFPLQNDGGAYATIMGRVDVLLTERDGLEVRDYKTSVDDLSRPEAENQIRLYTLGLQNMDRSVLKGSIADLTEPSIEYVSIQNELLSDAKSWAEDSVKRIVERDFQPCPGDYCINCDFQVICRWKR
jgi:DNA helicase II / ATP-dependent DNA helicase PcrA